MRQIASNASRPPRSHEKKHVKLVENSSVMLSSEMLSSEEMLIESEEKQSDSSDDDSPAQDRQRGWLQARRE